MNRRKTDYKRGPTPLFKFVMVYLLVNSVIAFCFFVRGKVDAQEAPIPQQVESDCIDGVVVIIEDNIYPCVNGEQGAGQLWTP